MELTLENIKPILVDYLKTKYIKGDVDRLWGETKHWFKSKLIEFGGGYASIGNDITIRTYINKEEINFKISLEEVE